MVRVPEVLRERMKRGIDLKFIPQIPFVRSYQQKEVAEFILELNKIEQLFNKGVNVNNEITGVYSEATELINPKKKAGEPYTFLDTGEFFKSFKLKVFSDGSFKINAEKIIKDPLTDAKFSITDLYGEILGLNDESLTKLSREILPFIREEVRSLVLGG